MEECVSELEKKKSLLIPSQKQGILPRCSLNCQSTTLFSSITMSTQSNCFEVDRVFIGAACNRIVNNVSWGASDLVAFGTQNAVAIFCPKSAQILTTLPGHNATVNCTLWLPSNKFSFKAKHLERHYLLSADTDGVIILWELSILLHKWKRVMQLPQSHSKGVTCIAGIMVSEFEAIFASTSSDASTVVWEAVFPSTNSGECEVKSLDSFVVSSKAMVALSLAELPGDNGNIVLAMGGLDNKIHIYCGKRSGKFVRACELKGHSDWIRSLDFSLPLSVNNDANVILLVSSSQDKSIRIWKIVHGGSLANIPETKNKKEISLSSYIEGPLFVIGSSSYQISLESLLIGHEDWVYSVEWEPPSNSTVEGVMFNQPQSILSASMDKTMMIWKPEKTSGLWMNVVTVGELSHCALGFYGGHWSPKGDAILAHGYGGSFHLWRNVGTDIDNWQPQKVPSGHFASVTDISWAKSGEYLLSVSHDQTARIFSPWKMDNYDEEGYPWYEIARPQVHGHDINCVTNIHAEGNYCFVSGAEEKVARVFEAPLSFRRTLNNATSTNSTLSEELFGAVQILGANMSALGLSQKPIYTQATDRPRDRKASDGADTLETVPEAVPSVLTEPPIEDQLAWHTLWPESHKLYGHGNELFSLCCDHQGKLLASSCKAQTANVAEIWLWEVGSWKAVGRLQSHALTITQMEFSRDSRLLLAVSRDRHFSVFKIDRKGQNDEIHHELISRQEAHRRIIWSCSWNPNGHEFATGSRDKMVKIWGVRDESSVIPLKTLPPFKSSVTALSWAGLDPHTQSGILAIGLESGLIELWNLSIKRSSGSFNPDVDAGVAVRLDSFLCHVSPVNRMSWREKHARMELASCGADHCVRVFRVKMG